MTNPPNYSELMNELWKASEGGTAAWWPERIFIDSCVDGEFDIISTLALLTTKEGVECLPHKYAYFIAKGHAEEWLKDLDWHIMYSPRLKQTWYEPDGIHASYTYSRERDPHSLPAALAYAKEAR